MSLQNKNVALLVHSCDRYELLYKAFEIFFSKNWDSAINCNCYFATEEKQVDIAGFKNIQSGKGEWADRLAFLLREKIKEPYIIYVQEDMWLNKKVNAAFFNKLFELTKNNNWQQVKLHSSGVYKTTATEIFIEGFNVAVIDNEVSDFLMSHQITLWNKDFLLKQLYKKEHPWRNERKATKRLRKLNPIIHHVDYFAENSYNEININNNPVLRSEYLTISVNGTLNSNANSYINEMLKSEDLSIKEYAKKLAFNLQNNMTHDGKPRPQKMDLYKRIKKWIRGR